MDGGASSSANLPPLQPQTVCKLCGYRGKNLVEHYVENHPGVAAPVHLTTKELQSLKNDSKKTMSGNSAANHDKENLLMEFLNKLGPEATFRSPVECPLCPYSTTSRSDMMNHLLIHQSTHFVCYFCSANETNLNDFRDHVSSHTGEYAYQCIHCTFRGAYSTDVARHITTSHPGKEAKTIFENVAQGDEDTLKGYACSHCGYIQMSKGVIEKHVSSVDTFCRGSSVIEFDLSKGRSATRPSLVKGTGDSVSGTSQLTSGNQNRVYIQDEIEIAPNEPAASDSILPYNNEQNREGWNPVLKIKTEKIENSYSRLSVNSPSVMSSNRSDSPQTAHAQMDGSNNNVSSDAPKETRPFVCASCQFSTKDETEFIKHARTDHRTDLSLWCKSCGKCFSNAGVLVTHIKEGSCEKEEMVYRCGVKECTFETPSGQTFVHHLRHCHKGSPFIFCVHCQKIFTLPHCLILHMQNDCPYKERNRKNPGQVSSETSTSTNSNIPEKVTATKPVTPTVSTVTPVRPILPRPAPSVGRGSSASSRGKSESRGRGPRGGPRGRPRGKGRGRQKFVDSESDSDPDDPSWTPEETPPLRPVRRSARFRGGEDTSNSTPQNESRVRAEPAQPRTEEFLSHAITCPSCDFATLSKTLLEDHYVSEHKKPDKNQCKLCSVKFETITAFTEHFETLHRKEIVSTERSTTPKVSSEPPNAPTPPAIAESDIVTSISSSIVDNSVALQNSDSVVKIPYQTAIHEKNQKDAKLKNFEELKAPNDIVKMKEELKLKHFFKCMLWNCTFTTDNCSFFISHLSDTHSDKKLYCSFCFKEFASANPLTSHMLSVHSKRCYQCSACFYRAFSKPHVQIHIKYNHSKETAVVYTSTTHLSNTVPPSDEEEEEVGQTTWPYHCAIGECKFKTFDPKDFKKHNEITHRAVSVFICYYCKAEFISFKRLMNHYRLHGINNYQCTYCLHGSDTKDEILAHLSQNHADKPFQVHMRAPQEGPFGKDKTSEADSIKVSSVADSNSNQNSSIKPDTPVEHAQKSYGKQGKATDLSEVASPVIIPIPAEKIKKEGVNKSSHLLVEKCIYEKVYPHHITDFESRFSCGIPTCEKQFEKMDHYLKHLQLNHIAMNIICPYCLEVSESELDFKDHLWHHGPNLFACCDEKCCYYHWKKDDVVQHMKVQHNAKSDGVVTIRHKELNESFDMELPDILCPEEKKDLDNLQVGFLCPFCYYKSKSRVTMKKHIYKEFEYMRFRCTHCDTKFCSQKDIRLHFLSEHTNEDIKAVLDLNAEVEHKVKAFLFCHQNTASNQVRNSQLANTKVDLTLFCADCNKKFPRARDWHEHLKLCLIHQYDANVLECVKCLVCSATFSELNLLKIHFRSSHAGRQLCFMEKPNRMEWMRETLLSLRLQYVEHAIDGLIKLCTGSVLADLFSWTSQCKLESKTYKCFYCSFTSSFKFNVERHLASSHSGKPIKIDRLTSKLAGFLASKQAGSSKTRKAEVVAYCCILCLRKFSGINKLQDHLNSSHSEFQTMRSYHLCAPYNEQALMEDGETKYECLYCNSGRKAFSEMQVHYEKYHPSSEFKMKGLLNGSKRKLSDSAVSEQPAKKIRQDGELLLCGHCLKSFMSLEELSVHCHIIHPGLPVRYEAQPSDGEVDSPSVCVSLSALEKISDTNKAVPSSSKGFKVSKFSCTYCGAMFNSSYQMEKHITSLHDQKHKKKQSHNLDRVTVCLEHKDLGTIRLSAVCFSQTFNIFPRVEVTDLLKK